ncbi:MAG: ABC transporter substrate-binding protein [Sulfolobales archaeon]
MGYKALSRVMLAGIIIVIVLVGVISAISLRIIPPGGGVSPTPQVTTAVGGERTATQIVTQATQISKKDLLRVAIGTDLDTLDPHGQTSIVVYNVLRHVYETLLWFDDKGNVIPWLAERWEVSPDGLSYTFYLRKGVRFHDGSEFDAYAVKANIDRWIDPSVRVPSRSLVGKIDRVEIIDNYTVRIYLKEPYSLFIKAIAYFVLITSPNVIKKFGNQSISEVIGTGPYRFVSWEKGKRVVLERNDDYWGPKPPIKRIEWLVIPEASTRLAALLAGDVDFIYAPPPPDLDRIASDPRFNVYTPVSNAYLHLSIIPRGPLADPRVRQALNYAIDKEAIVKNILYGLGIPADSAVPPNFFGYARMEPYQYDPERARRLLAEAGYPNGFKMVILHPTGGSGFINDKGVAEAIQAYLSKIGIQVELRTGDWPSYIAELTKPLKDKQYDAVLRLYGPAIADAHFLLYPLLHSSQRDYPNINNYSNPEVDALLSQAASEINATKRAELYRKAIEIVWRDAPWVFLAAQKQFYAGTKELKGIFIFPSGLQIYFYNSYFS